MPRNSQGLYTLPAGNPVSPNTLIESAWANTTMDDLAVAMTNSLPRNGTAPMTGPLTLSTDPITQARQAASKAYVDQFLAYSTGMPIAAISPYAGPAAPPGWLLCDGQAVSRTTYADLFAAIGVIYGTGDGTTTFNVPDLRNEFIRGLGGSRTLGSKQIGTFAAHTHGITDPGHSHNHLHAVNTTTSVEDATHSHTVNDPGHFHSYEIAGGSGGSLNTGGASSPLGNKNVDSKATGIWLDGENATHRHVVNANTTESAVVSGTGVTTIGAGGSETVPQNMALNYYIKAVVDSGSSVTPVLAVESSDTAMISINETNPSIPIITPHANVPGGIPKLDANAKVPLAQIPNAVQNNLGFFNAAPGLLPVGTFASGDTYTISVAGTLTVYDPVTLVAAPTVVPAGTDIIYITGSPTNPTGWYAEPLQTNVVASSVAFTPGGTISAGNVQAAIAELDSETQAAFGAVSTALAGKAPSSAATAAGTSFAPAGTIAATNVQAAIQEMDTEKAPSSAATAVGTSFTPVGDITATNVQAAIAELDGETQGSFALMVPQGTASFGSVRFPGGLQICWNVQALDAGGNSGLSFHRPFSQVPAVIVSAYGGESLVPEDALWSGNCNSLTATNCQVSGRYKSIATGPVLPSTLPVHVISIGFWA